MGIFTNLMLASAHQEKNIFMTDLALKRYLRAVLVVVVS